jgi:hypothetical protein
MAAAVMSGVSMVLGGVAERYRPAWSKREQFSREVAKKVTNEKFTSELSEQLGVPGEGETEEEFVARARGIFRRLAKAHLK